MRTTSAALAFYFCARVQGLKWKQAQNKSRPPPMPLMFYLEPPSPPGTLPPPPPPPPPSPASPSLHVVIYVSREQYNWYTCWKRWFSDMVQADPVVTYYTHVKIDTKNVSLPRASAQGRYRDIGWYRAVHEKIFWMQRILYALREFPDEPVLYADLDVVPFRPFSWLLPYLNGTIELLFMKMGQSLVNTGLMLMRNSHPVRRFYSEWAEIMRRDSTANDQKVVYDLLAQMQQAHTIPSWTTFPKSVASDHRSTVAFGATVAFHAVSNPHGKNVHTKAMVLKDAFTLMTPLRNATARWCNPDHPGADVQNKLWHEDSWVFGTPKGIMRTEDYPGWLKRERLRGAHRNRTSPPRSRARAPHATQGHGPAL
eukprot:4217245-Prymnesium_polylepis.1